MAEGRKEGFVVPALKSAATYLRRVLPMGWLACISANFRLPSASTTEKYVFFCLAIELIVMVLWWSMDHFAAVGWLIVVFAVLRMVEIIVRTGDVDVRKVLDRHRTLALGAINYVELALCFGAIYAFNYHCLKGADRPIVGYYFSIITQLTIGYGDISPMGWLRLVAAVQGLVGAFFVILVFARAVGALSILEDK